MNINFVNFQNLLVSVWGNIENTLKGSLSNFDPSLFQNIILGILAIFIPFAIVFLTDILNSKEERNEFEKMVLTEEVLGTKKVFWISVIGIGILAFFSGTNVPIVGKLIAIIFSIFIIAFLFFPFKKTLRFAEGYKPEFEISFLRRMNLSSSFSFGNKRKGEKMIRAWNSFWSKKSSYNERAFTEVLIKHIDTAINANRFDLAILLAQAYQKNIDKREEFSIGYSILPKVFEWHKKFWKAEHNWVGRENLKDKIIRSISDKYFPTLKKWISVALQKIFAKDYLFWNWHYFQQDFLPVVTKILLKDGYRLFDCFKKHIDEVYAKMEETQNDDEKQELWNYISGLFGSFCKVFFENVNSVPSGFDIWEHYFPQDWKITHGNSEKKIPRIILHEFLQWAQPRIFKKKESDYDEELSDVANGLFPNAHSELFPVFLVLLFATEIKYAIKKEPSFSLINTGISYSEKKSDQEIQQMFAEQSKSQKAETIDIIFDYFSNSWRYLKIYKDDISEEEFSNWNSYTEDQQKEIVKRVRKNKLQGAIDELNSQEIINSCKDPEILEYQRKDFIELMELVLKRVDI